MLALWLHGLLAAYRAQGSPCPQQATVPSFCQAVPKVCVDQNVFVLYGNQHNPRHELFSQLPAVRPDNISIDYFGYGDLWGTSFAHPPQLVRPATGGEETQELRHPQFSRCTTPMVLYVDHLYMYGRFFASTVAVIHMMQQSQMLDRRLTIVLDTFGMQLEPFHHFLLAPFSAHEVTTLSYLSSRQQLEKPERYSPDGQHVRCFWQLLACQMGGAPQVLIAARPRSSKLRTLLNQEQVWSWCNKFQPPRGVKHWNGTACLLHEFGRDHLSDVSYSSQADVLLGVHSDSLFNAFAMKQHSSLIEIRPFGHGMHHSHHLQHLMTSDDDSIFWWGVDIVKKEHSTPGDLELQQRGASHSWPRERHSFIRLMALQYVMERIALTRHDVMTYNRFREKGQNHINDKLLPGGCGSGCTAYVKQFKGPVDPNAPLPHKMFGNFKGCNGDKWPHTMCSLKSIKDPKNPKITSTSEITSIFIVAQ
eukprot:gene8998-9171_t